MNKKILLFGLVLLLFSSFVSSTDFTTNNEWWVSPDSGSITDDSSSISISNTGVTISSNYMVFDGSNDYITLGNNLRESDNQGTAVTNLKLNINNVDYQSLQTVASTSSGSPVLKIIIDSSGKIVYVFRTDASTGLTICTGTTTLNTGTNYQIAVSSTGSAFEFNINGISESFSCGVGSDNGYWYNDVGNTYTHQYKYGNILTTDYLNADVKYLAYYSTKLTTTELLELYNKGTNYNPYIESNNYVIFTAKDIYTDINITTFNATFVNSTSTETITTTNGSIYYYHNLVYNITYTAPDYYEEVYYNYNTSSDLNGELTQAYLQLVLTNLVNTTQYSDVTWFINETTSGVNKTVTSNGTVAYVNATSGSYTYTASKTGYPSVSGTFALSALDNKTIYAATGFYAEINLIDEANLTVFNIGETNGTKAIVVCSGIGSYTYDLVNETQNISIPCLYKSLRITVTYDDVTYSRNILSSETDVFSQDVYLVDMTTTQSLENAFVINDYAGEYKNVEMYIKKNIEGKQVVIHSDFLDAENKMSALLIDNDVYILSLLSSNKPELVLGFYGADISGTKEITVTSANNDIEAPEYVGDGIIGNMFSTGNGTSLLANSYYEDKEATTTSITWELQYLNKTNSSLETFYSVNINNSNTVTFVSQNISEYSNTSVYGVMTYIHSGDTDTLTKLLYEPVPSLHAGTLFAWFDVATLQWGVIIILSVILLIGTISTQNIVNYVVLGMGALASVFDLWTVSVLILVFGLLINFIYHLKTEEQRKVLQ